MGATSNESKQRWKEANYAQLNVSLPPEIVSGFKARCLAANVSMRGELSKLMSGAAPPKPARVRLETRRDRRKAVKKMVECLEDIIGAETGYIERIPENLANSAIYEAAEETVSALGEALEILGEAYK
jgi:hypothetical protein